MATAKNEPISYIEQRVYMTTLERNILGIICDCYAYDGIGRKEATRHQAVVARRIAHWVKEKYELKPKYELYAGEIPF